jgi:hypothetical protein
MRTSKKMIAGVSAFIVAVSSIAMTVSAVDTDDFTVSVSVNEEYAVENQVQLTVDLANVPSTGIAGFEFAVSFDSSALELVSVEENPDVVGGASDKEIELVPDLKGTMVGGEDDRDYSCFDYYVSGDKIACMWATGLEDSAYWINTDGTVATFTFEVIDKSADSVDVGIVPIHDSDDSEIVFAAADASGNYYAYQDVQQGEDVSIDLGDTASGSTSESVTTTTAGSEEPGDTETTTTANGGESTEPDVTTGEQTPGESTGVKGDANNDGDVNSVDVLLVKKYVLTMVDSDALNTTNADVNGDGSVQANDLLLIKKFVLQMIDNFD